METLANDSLSSTSERLVLVSDASTEAERLIASMRVRKVKVRDVPLMLLAGRVEAQKPKLVICDGQAPRVVQALEKMRQGAWGAKVELLLLGIDVTVVDAIRATVTDIETRLFARPIDVYSVMQRIEEILGEAAVSDGSRSMASLPRVEPNSIASACRITTPVPRRPRSSNPHNNARDEAQRGVSQSEPPSVQPRMARIFPNSETNTADSALAAATVGRMSEELENLLKDADRRLGTGPISMQPLSVPSVRLTPEQELDAILPADVLSALDEPIDLDDDDETSHPAGRVERHSSMESRSEPAAVLTRGTTNAEASPERGTGTSPSDEDTPVGRWGARRHATATESEPSSVPRIGSVLTPVPASVRTHNTHLGQPNLSQGSSPTASDQMDNAFLARDPHRTVEDSQGRALLEPEGKGKVLAYETGASDSAVPGTNPALYESDSVGLGDVSSTAPPHPLRARTDDSARGWSSLEDDAASVIHSEERANIDLSPFRTRRDYAAASPTIPPLGALSPPQYLPEREIANPESRTRLEPYGGSELRRSGRHEPEPRPLIEPRGRERRGSEPREPEARERVELRPANEGNGEGRVTIDIPTALGKGDVVRALARCVRGRYSGALAIEDEAGIRRVVLREGDFVMVASGIEGESLVAFLIQRGDLDSDAARLTRKLPQFGRHAGAALIAHGYLRQDELWPVLRAHAEWLLGRALGVQQGSAGLEVELSARLQAEPAVFGGTTGAEVLVEIVRRIVSPDLAVEALGGPKTRVTRGPLLRLLSECALLPLETHLVERAEGIALDELTKQAQSPDFASAVYALVELSILETLAPYAELRKRSNRPPPRDGLDDDAVRSRVALRRALVDDGDYFALLGIAHEATGYEVRHAYLSLRREFDPGRLLTAATAGLREDVELIVEVLDEAYDVLRDSARRERYRRALEAAPV